MSNAIYKLIRGSAPLYYTWLEVMHTRLDIVLCGLSEDHSEEVAAELIAEVRRLEKRLNRFDKQSDLFYINSHAQEQPLRLDKEMWGILDHCRHLKGQTYGYFDVCVATKGDYLLNESGATIEFNSPYTRIDLGGYAKGLALEQIKKKLWVKGVKNALINFGNSSVYGVGSMPFTDKGWQVAVEDIYRPSHSVLDITLSDNSLSTSGNTGKTEAHIYSPITGQKVEGEGAVSIVCPSPLDSEVLSTALFAAENMEEQIKILEQFELVEAYTIRYADPQSPPVVSLISGITTEHIHQE